MLSEMSALEEERDGPRHQRLDEPFQIRARQVADEFSARVSHDRVNFDEIDVGLERGGRLLC